MRLALALLVVTGCGGLSPDFVGTWTGTTVVTLDTSSGPVVQSTDMAHITVEATNGVFEAIVCADSSGRLRFEGGGSHGTWSGVQSCKAPTPDCATATVIFRTGTADLAPGPRLKALVTGTATACLHNWPLTYEFNGTK